MPHLLQQGDMIGKYCVERSLGSGGMGAVYLVRHIHLNVMRAMKLLHTNVAEKDPEFKERFIREARYAARVQHPNIVTVIDVETQSESGFLYLVMEYIDGQSVSQLLKNGPLSERRALFIIREAAKGLAYAAEHGLVHRDIKPANVMVTNDGMVKLADMGIAKTMESSGNTRTLTVEGSMIGTPAYASPEQCRDAHMVDTRADIYSLGATLYEMLTGHAPFEGGSPFEIMAQVLRHEPVPLEKYMPEVTPQVAFLVRWMMSKNADDRPQTMVQLLDELYRFDLSDESPSTSTVPVMEEVLESQRVHGQSRFDRLEKMRSARRRQKRFRILLLIFLLVSIGFIGILLLDDNMLRAVIPLSRKKAAPVVEKPVQKPRQLRPKKPSFESVIAAERAKGIQFSDDGRVLMKYPPSLQEKQYTVPAGVTQIGKSAFADCRNLTSISLPSTLKSVGDYAFSYCRSLTGILLPDSVTSIGAYAFFNCNKLTDIIIPPSVTVIGNSAFSYCGSLLNVTIPDGVTLIDNSAFWGCRSLKMITLPGALKRIGNSAFWGCSNLESITIPGGVTRVGNNAFADCDRLKSVTVPEHFPVDAINSWNLKPHCKVIRVPVNNAAARIPAESMVRFSYDRKVLIKYPATFRETHYTIPEGVAVIGEGAFSGSRALQGVTIPETVTNIEAYAFADCLNLANLQIPAGVTQIAAGAFGGVKSVYVKRGNHVFERDHAGALIDNRRGMLLYFSPGFKGNYIVPDKVKVIGDNAFANCTGITGVTMKNGVTRISPYAFWGCRNLVSVAIPATVSSIGGSAFANCTALTAVTIPASVKSAGSHLFANCTALKTLTVPGHFSDDDLKRWDVAPTVKVVRNRSK